VGTVICAKVSTAGRLLGGYQFSFSVNEGEGYYLNSTGARASIATMHRLANRADTGTGIVLKTEANDDTVAPAVSPEQLRLAIESVAAQAE